MRTAVVIIKLLVPENIRKHKIFANLIFFPSLMYNVLMEKFTDRRWYDRIDDTIVLGALPFKSVAERLVKEENVKAVVTMNEDFELRWLTPGREGWKNLGVDFLQLPTQDIFSAPDGANLRKGVDFIREFEKRKDSVYVHCKAGRTRSATLVGCYLMEKHKYDPQSSFATMQKKRPHVLLEEPQWKALREHYEKYVCSSAGQK